MEKQKLMENQAEQEQTRMAKNSLQRKIQLCGIILAVILVIATALAIIVLVQPEPMPGPTTISEISLEEILEISELSTATFVYKGIAEGRNERNQNRIDYYVSYAAEVTAGIDFEKIQELIDEETKTLYLILPEVLITSISVDPNSLDFMFMNEKSNTAEVVKKALTLCETDVTRACEPQKAVTVYELAYDNAVKAVTALVEPVLDQLKEPYTLVIE